MTRHDDSQRSDRLAVTQVRLGKYAEAAQAWRKAEKSNPADANRARYCWHLAEMADQIGKLPTADPSGRSWEELSKEELESTMSEQAVARRFDQNAAYGVARGDQQNQGASGPCQDPTPRNLLGCLG